MSRAFWTWMLLAIALGAAMALSMVVGDGDLSNPELRDTYLELRWWRLTNSMLAGSALALGGVLVQGLFRNPLASPSILGTTAGASLGGVLMLFLWNSYLLHQLPDWVPFELVLPVGCLVQPAVLPLAPLNFTSSSFRHRASVSSHWLGFTWGRHTSPSESSSIASSSMAVVALGPFFGCRASGSASS